jgi:hypothetical protein
LMMLNLRPLCSFSLKVKGLTLKNLFIEVSYFQLLVLG